MPQAHPYLNFAGNAEQAFNFYRTVFGGDFTSLVRFKDMPMEGVTVPIEDQDKILHVGLPLGEGSVLMASDALASLGHEVTMGNNFHVSLHPGSRDEADRLFAALSEGGTVEMPMADQPWGDYYGSLRDRFEVPWMINFGTAS